MAASAGGPLHFSSLHQGWSTACRACKSAPTMSALCRYRHIACALPCCSYKGSLLVFKQQTLSISWPCEDYQSHFECSFLMEPLPKQWCFWIMKLASCMC